MLDVHKLSEIERVYFSRCSQYGTRIRPMLADLSLVEFEILI
jgi:hypothetical protein